MQIFKVISTTIKSKNSIKIVATLNGSSGVLKVIDITDKGPNPDAASFRTVALWPCISMALKTLWLSPISVRDRDVGPEQRTGRNGTEREDPLSAQWGLQWAYPLGAGGGADRALMLLSPPQTHRGWLHGFWARLQLATQSLRHWEPQAGSADVPKPPGLGGPGWWGSPWLHPHPHPHTPALSCALLFLQLFSVPYWFDLLSPYISASGNLMLHSHLA